MDAAWASSLSVDELLRTLLVTILELCRRFQPILTAAELATGSSNSRDAASPQPATVTSNSRDAASPDPDPEMQRPSANGCCGELCRYCCTPCERNKPGHQNHSCYFHRNRRDWVV